uniref:NB-ARC domain-containing protein n=1 Tax=Oryza rufipogon TaxID=4529 RepID=A0A0E0PW76_ORYRU
MDAVETIISTGINIHEATQLSNELSRLQATLPKARFLINRGEWGRFKNKDMALLLSQLKDTTYDAEDLLRESDDQALRQKMEDADRNWFGKRYSSILNLAKILIRGSKTKIKEAREKLDKAVADLEGVLNSVGVSIEAVQHMPETSSVICVSQVFGRDKERDLVIEKLGVCSMIGCDSQRDHVIELLGVPLITRSGVARARAKGKRAAAPVIGNTSASSRAKQLKRDTRARPRLAEAKCIDNVPVLPIFGIGGVGKTTLAQFIYNDPRVQAHFGNRRVWVCVSDLFDKKRVTKEIIESFNREEYKPLCGLDALQVELMEQLERQKFLLVLDDIWQEAIDEWESFYAPFKNGPKGSMILVTTRFTTVADRVATNNCKPIQLEGLDRDIFWEFFSKCAFGEECPESYPQLQDIGQSIASRLCGSPLAAKTTGRLLNMKLTVQHWETVQNRGITRLQDMGIRYLDDLRSRFLFQTDPMYPDQTRYVMHDLIHDMAQSVYVDECLLMQDLRSRNERRMLHVVRHMSVKVADESLKNGMRGIQDLNKLNSLRFGIKLNVEITWFNQLSNILYLSLKGCKLVKLPESIGELNSLRYLDISRSGVQELPKKFCSLYSLQVVDASHSSLKVISLDVIKLINLRRLALPNDKEAAEASLVEKQYLQELVLLWRGHGKEIGKSSENGVVEALHPPPRIECLKVQGFGGDSFSPSWFRPECLLNLRSLELSKCDGLKNLSIASLPSLERLMLEANLRMEAVTILGGSTGGEKTKHASSSSSNYTACLRGLTTIRLVNCYELQNLDGCLSPEYLPSIECIEINKSSHLGLSIHVDSFVGFEHLQESNTYKR